MVTIKIESSTKKYFFEFEFTKKGIEAGHEFLDLMAETIKAKETEG